MKKLNPTQKNIKTFCHQHNLEKKSEINWGRLLRPVRYDFLQLCFRPSVTSFTYDNDQKLNDNASYTRLNYD